MPLPVDDSNIQWEPMAPEENRLVFLPSVQSGIKTLMERPRASLSEVGEKLLGATLIDNDLTVPQDRINQDFKDLAPADRYQTWPEKMVKSAVTLPHDVLTGSEPIVDPATGHTSDTVIQRTQDLAGMAGGGMLLEKPGTATLGSGPMRQYPMAPRERWYGEANYQTAGGRMETMSPDEFLSQARPMKIDEVARENIDDLKQHILSGKELDPLKLYEKGKEDGRHRAIAAKELGIEEVPVVNFRSDTAEQSGLSALANQTKAPTFYSAVENAVKNAKQEKATGEQWVNYLRNQPGVKQEELGWLGLDAVPEALQGAVTKKQLEDYMNSHKVELKEVQHTDQKNIQPDQIAVDKWQSNLDEAVDKKTKLEPLNNQAVIDFKDGKISRDELATINREYRTANNEVNKINDLMVYETGERQNINGSTKYHDYQLPGGENYREMLMTLPKKERPKIMEDGELVKDFNGDNPNYKSSHWDEPNVLAHIRMNDRTINGQKTLHLEEIQSDWHQAGRKEGYKDDTKIPSPRNFVTWAAERGIGRDEAVKIWNNRGPIENERLINEHLAESEARTEAQIRQNKAVPDAPFKKTWDELALKRMIRHAAENGYDQISWTPGEAQAARYDLSKHIDNIQYVPSKNGKTVSIDAIKDGKHVFSKANEPIENLPNIVGKEVAHKISKGEGETNNEGYQVLSGLDLKVGGEGMKAFYDKMLVDKMNNIAKKFGGKVEQTNVETNKSGWHITPPSETVSGKWMVKSKDYNSKGLQFETEAEAKAALKERVETDPVHVIKLPQKLKDTALNRGFPLFASGLPFTFTPVSGNPFEPDK